MFNYATSTFYFLNQLFKNDVTFFVSFVALFEAKVSEDLREGGTMNSKGVSSTKIRKIRKWF